MIKIASWNVNSIGVRLEHVLNWMIESKTDILAIQETKVVDEKFPEIAFQELGFQVVYSGQKTYNGVAVISRKPIQEVVTALPDFDDPQRRLLAVTIDGIRIVNLYVPNGSEVGSEKYAYKLNWLTQVERFLEAELKQHPNLVVLGDFNIAPDDLDVHNPADWEGSVLVCPPVREALEKCLKLGLKDSFRVLNPGLQAFSWWDYRAANFRRNRGLRIDLILLSAPIMKVCTQSGIDIEPRRWERPSDHTPVWVGLNI